MNKQQLEEIVAEARAVAALFVEHYMVPNTWEPVRKFLAKLEEHDGPIPEPAEPDPEPETATDASVPSTESAASTAPVETSLPATGGVLAEHLSPPAPQGPIGIIEDNSAPAASPDPAPAVEENVSPPEVSHDELQPAAREALPTDGSAEGGV